jgi:hypothetical protein
MRKRVGLFGVVGIAAVLVVSLASTSMAYAQGPRPPKGGRTFGAGESFGCVGRCGDAALWQHGPLGWAMGMHGFSLVDATAEVTGLTVQEIVAALQDGQTLAEIAESQGVDPQAIVDAFLADREAALAEAVAEGRLTEEQAEQMLEEMAEHVAERLEESWAPPASGGGATGGGSAGCGAGLRIGSGTGRLGRR